VILCYMPAVCVCVCVFVLEYVRANGDRQRCIDRGKGGWSQMGRTAWARLDCSGLPWRMLGHSNSKLANFQSIIFGV